MSSPAPSASGGDRKNPVEQITFRFCSECSNMLYPKEDEAERKLMFTCRTCNYSEEATSSCIFRNTMNNAAGETAGVTQDVGSDPTVGSFFPSFPSIAPDLETSDLSWTGTVSSCLTCGDIITCDTCGSPFDLGSPVLRPVPSIPDMVVDNGSDAGCDLGSDLEDIDVDLDNVEIFTWTGDSLDELGAILHPEDMLGLEEVVKAEVDADPKPSPVLVPTVLHQPSVSAAAHG
jgi:DNA-directed RNA polymerase II subunit RPB9